MSHPDGDELKRFQTSFVHALTANDSSRDDIDLACIAELVVQPGFSVYRNTLMKACVDALQANYPAVSRLVGDEWFRAAAGVFARANLPRHPALIEYGDGFPEFLADFAPAAELPYLAGVATLDRLWTQAHLARDAPPLEAAAVAMLCAEALADTVLTPHPSTRWALFDAASRVPDIWRRNRDLDSLDEPAPPGPRADGMLIVRPHDAVDSRRLGADGCAFLDVCMHGGSLAAAAAASLEARPDADLSQVMALLLGAGAFCGITLPGAVPHKELS